MNYDLRITICSPFQGMGIPHLQIHTNEINITTE